MIAPGLALAALTALAGLEMLDPPQLRAAQAAFDAAVANAVPVGTWGGTLAMVEVQGSIARGVFAFLVIAVAATGAGRAAGRWTRTGRRDALGAVTILLLGWAVFAGLLLGFTGLRIAHPPVVGVAAAFAALGFRGPATVAGWLRAALRPVLGWPRRLAIASAILVAVAALAPATGVSALQTALPAAAALRWGEAGAVEALMGAALGLTGGSVDGAARLWSVAGWLAAGLALAAAFRPRDAAGRAAAFAIVATSPALARLALDDQSRLFMLAPAVACAGWIGRGRLLRGAAMAVIASWFGAGGDPGHVATRDLARLALTGAAVGALIAARQPGAWLRRAATAALALGAFHTAALAGATGSLLAGCGLESHPGYFLRTTGTYAEMLAKLDRTVPPGGKVWLSGDDRRYPPIRRIITDQRMSPSLDDAYARPDRYGPRLRQLGVRWVMHLPGSDRMEQLAGRRLSATETGTSRSITVRTDGSWEAWWAGHARTVEPPDRLDGERGGYYLYLIADPGPGRGPRPVTAPLWNDAARTWFPQSQARSVLAAFDDAFTPSAEEEAILLAAERGGYRSVLLYRALARGAVRRGSLVGALAWLDRLDALDPRSGATARLAVLRSLAEAARARRDPAAAERYLRAALELNPADAPSWAKLAEILIWLGRRPEAMDAMEEAIRLDPAHPGYRGTLGHLRRAT